MPVIRYFWDCYPELMHYRQPPVLLLSFLNRHSLGTRCFGLGVINCEKHIQSWGDNWSLTSEVDPTYVLTFKVLLEMRQGDNNSMASCSTVHLHPGGQEDTFILVFHRGQPFLWPLAMAVLRVGMKQSSDPSEEPALNGWGICKCLVPGTLWEFCVFQQITATTIMSLCKWLNLPKAVPRGQ